MSAWNRALIFGRLNNQFITFGMIRKIEPKLVNLKGQDWLHLLAVRHLPLANPHPQVGLVGQSCFQPCSYFASDQFLPKYEARPSSNLAVSSHDISPLHNSEYDFMKYYNVWHFMHRSNIRGKNRLNPNKSWHGVWVDKNAREKKTFWVDKNAGEISSIVKSSRSVRCQLRCLQRKQQCRAIELWSSSFLSLQIDIHGIGDLPVGFGKWHWKRGVEKGKKTWINKLKKLIRSNGCHLAPSDYQMITTCQQVIL